MRHLDLWLVSATLACAELSVSPERLVIDARVAEPSAVSVSIGVTAGKGRVESSIIDLLAAMVGPDVDIGRPVFPITLSATQLDIEAMKPATLTVDLSRWYRDESLMKSWDVSTHVVRIKLPGDRAAAVDVPVVIRQHASPWVTPRLPIGIRAGPGWTVKFGLRTGNADERIISVDLVRVQRLGEDGDGAPTLVPASLSRANEGACILTIEKAEPGPAIAVLKLAYDQPAKQEKLLSVRIHLGELPAAGMQEGEASSDEGTAEGRGPRRVRIH